MIKALQFISAWCCLALAFIGIFLPLLPTTPLVLLAAWLFSKSSPRFQYWLHHHPQFGPMINDWEQHRRIPLRAKVVATIMISTSVLMMLWIPIVWWARTLAFSCMACVLLFLWTRPSH